MFGIDSRQYRALVITALRIDLRASGGAVPRPRNAGAFATLGAMILFHGIVGLAFAALAYRMPDVLLGASLFLTYVSFAVLLSVLVDYHSVVTSPDDYAVLGFRPLSSRTYFAARLTNLFIFTAIIATALGVAPVAAYTLRGGIVLGLAAAAAAGGTAFTTALGAVIVYAWLVGRVSPARVSRALTYAQLALSVIAYSAFALVPDLLSRRGAFDLVLPRTAWLHVHPAIWFARYLEIADGVWGAGQIVPAAASVTLMGALVLLASGRLSLEYAERLGELSVASAPAPARAVARRPAHWRFSSDEHRAVAVLVRAQFRHDQKFRLAVLAILPITFFYLLVGMRDQTLTDPFGRGVAEHPAMLYYGVLLFPIMLHMSLTRSDSPQAAWIFYASPASLSGLVRAMKNYLMTRVVAPYLVVLAAIFAWYFDAWWHVVVHSLVLLMFSHAMLLLTVTMDPELPFARPSKHGERTAHMFVTFTIASVAGMVLIPMLGRYLYVSTARLAILFAALIALNGLLDLALRARLRRLATRTEFAG